jgi:hypothetical protein
MGSLLEDLLSPFRCIETQEINMPFRPYKSRWGMWFLFSLFFMFFNFYWLDLHNKTCVALADLWWSISKNQVENWTSHDVSHPYLKCMFVDSLIEYIGLPDCEWGIVDEMWRCSPISLNMCLCGVCFSILPNHIPIKYTCPVKKSNWIAPVYFTPQ